MGVRIRQNKQKLFEDAFQRLSVTSSSTNGLLEHLRQSDLLPILLDALKLSDELTPNEKLLIVRTALQKAQASSEDFLDFASAKQAEILSQPLKLFYITATISLTSRHDSSLLFRRCVQRTNFIISRRFPKKLTIEPFHGNGFYKIGHHGNPSFACVYGFTKAKTVDQASAIMLDDLDLLISCCNFVQNYGQRHLIRNQAASKRKIETGRFFLIHNAKGEVNKDRWWHETNHLPPLSLTEVRPEGDNWIEAADHLLRTISNLKYGSPMKRALQQINAALADSDTYNTLTKLWAALEIITGSTQGDSTQTIKRASFFSSYGEERRIILKYISEVRNRYVHTGNRDGLIESLTENLRIYIELIIEAVISPQFSDLSHSDLVEIMDQPPNNALLTKKRDLIERAIKIVGG